MKKITRVEEYRVSERVVLTPGDKFRATGGPYWKTSSGEKVSLKSSGPYKFICLARRGSLGWIECYDKNGAFAVLHVEGRRRRIDCSLVPRPYTVTGKKRPNAKA